MKQTRFSKQRELIYETLRSRMDHPTAETLYQVLKPQHPSLSLGTVYRNLNLLVSEGRAVRMPFPVDRYDANTAEHPHFSCVCCGNLYDLDLPVNAALNKQVEDLGFEVTRHDLVFKGICLSCSSHKKPNIGAN